RSTGLPVVARSPTSPTVPRRVTVRSPPERSPALASWLTSPVRFGPSFRLFNWRMLHGPHGKGNPGACVSLASGLGRARRPGPAGHADRAVQGTPQRIPGGAGRLLEGLPRGQDGRGAKEAARREVPSAGQIGAEIPRDRRETSQGPGRGGRFVLGGGQHFRL